VTSHILAALAITGIVTSAVSITTQTRSPAAIPTIVLKAQNNRLVTKPTGTATGQTITNFNNYFFNSLG